MYKLTVITPEKIVFEEDVVSLTARGGEGYLQVLTNHCSLLTNLQPGRLTIEKQKGGRLEYAVSGGLLEVSHNEVSILVDAMETPEEIDLARAQSSLERAEERLKNRENHVDIARATEALKRAQIRIKIRQEHLLSKEAFGIPTKIEV